MKKIAIAVLAAFVFPLIALAAGMPAGVIVIPAGSVKWTPGTGDLKDLQLAVLAGNPEKAGSLYTLRIKFPDGATIPPHSHKMTEQVTILSGTFLVGLGDKVDPSKMVALGPGSFASLAPGVHHYARAKGETVIELHGVGPEVNVMVHPGM